jgi:hypothetical protein
MLVHTAILAKPQDQLKNADIVSIFSSFKENHYKEVLRETS